MIRTCTSIASRACRSSSQPASPLTAAKAARVVPRRLSAGSAHASAAAIGTGADRARSASVLEAAGVDKKPAAAGTVLEASDLYGNNRLGGSDSNSAPTAASGSGRLSGRFSGSGDGNARLARLAAPPVDRWAKCEAQRQEREAAAMQHCSFRPKTVKHAGTALH